MLHNKESFGARHARALVECAIARSWVAECIVLLRSPRDHDETAELYERLDIARDSHAFWLAAAVSWRQAEAFEEWARLADRLGGWGEA